MWQRQAVELADLLAQLAIPIPKVTTPQMFTYQLREQARSHRKRIVLPEGDDDRILKSAGRVLQRGIADLTILGDGRQDWWRPSGIPILQSAS